jgi:hypothetical protein
MATIARFPPKRILIDPLMLKLYQELLVKFNHYTILLPGRPYRQRIEGFDNQVESLLEDLGEKLGQLRQEQEKGLQEETRH